MTKDTRPLFPQQQRAVVNLGARLRLARLRRRMPAVELAERAGVSRMTTYKLERGDTSVGLDALVRVLGVLGLDQDLDLIAVDDELGRRLQDSTMPRPHRSVR
ncbi:MAG: helix-turn-helix transcriptional regulator [Chloroflexi bacterium]|nr:helix-turn-helix transcriptional regulator [Chloroflexota bacterium]